MGLEVAAVDLLMCGRFLASVFTPPLALDRVQEEAAVA